MRNLRLSVSTLAIAVLLSGCGTTSEVVNQEAKSIAQSSVGNVPTDWAAVGNRVGDVQIGWVDALGDPVLSKLVDEAQANNRNLQASAANVDKSWALAKQAGAALSPQVNLSAGGGGSGNGDGASGGSFNVGVQASWELDIWGRISSGQQAAAQSAESADADYKYAQHSLAAAVARAYFIAIEAQRQEKLANDVVDAISKIANIVQIQFDNGAATQQDVSLARSDLATAKDSLASAKGGKRDALRALELLLGRYPGADIKVRSALPAVPPPPPAGIPSAILERRPDIIAAERRIAAAINTVNQAHAAKLPSVSLSGSLGGSSGGLSSLLSPTNLAWQLASSLLVPVMDGGALDAGIEITDADQKAAVAAYAEAALQAFGEVETALDQGVVLRERKGNLNEAVREINTALKIAEIRFAEGESDLLEVLQIQQRKFAAQSNLISLERSELDQFINLNLALGGSWK
jgi:NodT family efflux transporter outer membrane factor (OMF) lipoprotein